MSDRNFDDLAERFEKRVHSSLKGDIRRAVIWRDLNEKINFSCNEAPLSILDLGGGLGHFSIALSRLGHQVTYNDISSIMMKKAQSEAETLNIKHKIHWSNESYQYFSQNQQQSFDIILCHAVIEWLEQPALLIPTLKKMLKKQGLLSLCFYNPAGLVYRNLICGNFRYVDQIQKAQPDSRSLTPQSICSIDQVSEWLEKEDLTVEKCSGIRVFSDYVLDKRGGNTSLADTLAAELSYSDVEPYNKIGRYCHILAVSSLSIT